MATNWFALMKDDPTAWLLEQDDPMVRYRTLTWIKERPETDPEVRAAREAAARHPRLEKLLAGQKPDGYWQDGVVFADDYYYGTAWRLYLAAQLGAARTEPVQKAVEFLFTVAQCRAGGGFSHVGTAPRGGTIGGQWACLTGALVEALIHFGYTLDPRTQRALGFLVSRQQADGLYPCENFSPNATTLPFNCYMGSVKPLQAVLALPMHRRTPEIRILIDRTVQALLTYHIFMYKRAKGGHPTPKPEWLAFGFPRFWNTDVLEVAWILARLGHGAHPALQPSLRLILSRQLKNGRWKLEFDYNERLPIRLGKRNVTNPWITLRALHTVKLASALARLQAAPAATAV